MSLRSSGFGKTVLLAAMAKASVTGAGLALAALASIDIAIAAVAKETWDSWQVDQFINQFAIFGGLAGAAWQLVKAFIAR